MACVDNRAVGTEEGRADRGHQLAKYLSCCAASQCAETHICSRRVAKAGAAPCKHCGGAGGGSEWAKTFAVALCDIFDCPAVVQREALDLVVSAVAFVPSPPSGRDNNDSDSSSGGGSKGGDGGRRRRTAVLGGQAAPDKGGGDRPAHDGGEDGSYGSSSEGGGSGGGLGSSWGSVSELAMACGEEEERDGCASGGGAAAYGRAGRVSGGGSRWEEEEEEDDDDDEVVRKGIWFPPPSTAGAKDPLLTTNTAGDGLAGGNGGGNGCYSAAAARRGEPRPPPRSLAARFRKRWQQQQQQSPDGTGGVAPFATPTTAATPAAPAAAAASLPSTTPASRRRGRCEEGRGGRGGVGAGGVGGEGGNCSYLDGNGEEPPSPPPLRAGACEGNPSSRSSNSSTAGGGGGGGLAEGAENGHYRQRDGGSGSGSGGGGSSGEAGSEFVVLVSREATVRELAASVGGFPEDWLGEAFGMVVRRQVEDAVYDARARAAIKRAVRLLGGRVSWKQVAVTEQELAALAQDDDHRIQDGDQNKEAAVSGRYWKVGLAAAGGGVLLFLSGGVAAPSVTASLSAVGFAAVNSVSYVAPSLGAWLGYTSTAAAASGAGTVGAFSAVSGAAGAGVAGYKMTRRTAGVQEFHFLPLHTEWPLDSPESMFEGASEPGLPVFICVSGWHEPGHDPRHIWGGIRYANVASTSETPGTSAENPPACPAPPPGSTAAGGSGAPRGRARGEPRRGRFGGTPFSPPAAAPSVPEFAGSGCRTAAATTMAAAGEAPAAAASGASGAVSRWFSAARGTASRDGGGGGGNHSGSRSSSSSSSSTGSSSSSSGSGSSSGINNHGGNVVGYDGRGTGGGDRETVGTRNRSGFPQPPPTQQQQQQQQQRHCIVSGGGGVSTTAPMVSSFIDLGLERATAATTTRHRRSHSNTSSSTGSVGSATTLQERGEGTGKGRDDEPRRRGRRRSRDGVQDSPGGVVILEGGDETAVDGGCGDDDDGEDDDAHGVMEDSWEALPSHAWWRDFVSGGEEHVLVWERGPLTELHAAMRDLAWKKASRSAVNEALKRSALAPVVAAAALPLALLEAASGLDDPWGVVRTRALEAGRLLAAVLLSRPVGSRPVTLLGYSMGAKLVFNCLEALAAAPNGRGLGIVENAVMLGTPIGTKRGRWKRVRSAVAGRLINGYSSRDWLLALVYRSKSWSLGVAGTSRVEGCGVENVDLSGLVTWHLSYSRILPTVMAMLRLEE